MIEEQSILQTAKWLLSSRSTIVFSGAGMSTESGIPDFRSPGGLWTKTDPMAVASVEAMFNQYDLFHEFYTLRFRSLQECNPHRGHQLLGEWEQNGLVHGIATQNVDGFHQQAGSSRVFELHGSLNSVRCIGQGHPGTPDQFMNRQRCPQCGDRFRPGVVLFGETLPMDAWNQAFQEIQSADVLLVIGTSLNVSPVNQLPAMARGKIILINREPVSGHYDFDAVLYGSAGDILAQLDENISGVMS